MRFTWILGSLVVVALGGNAMAGVILNSTEVFPVAGPSWGAVPSPWADPAGWNTTKATWGKYTCTFGGNANVPSHTADGSAVLRNKTTGGGSGMAYIQFTSTPGLEYILTGYVQKDQITDTWTEFQLLDGADWSGWDTGGFCDVITVPQTGTWIQFGKTVQATGTKMTIILKSGSTRPDAPNTYWDDISIVEVPEPATLLLLAPVSLLLRRRWRA